MDSNSGGQSSAVPRNQSSNQSSEQQRQTAASIARKKVLAAYGHAAEQAQGAINTAGSAATSPAAAQAQNRPVTAAAQNQAAAAAAQGRPGAAAKNQAAPSRQNSESWKKYHSAWQNYYQKYYSEYYASAARNYVEKERLRDARKRAEEEDALNSIGKIGIFGQKTVKNGQKSAFFTQNGAKNGENSENNAENGNLAQTAGVIVSGDEIDNIGAKLKQTIRKKAVKNVKKSRRRRCWIPVLAGVFVVLFVLFMQYNRLIFAPIFAYMSPGEAPATSIEAIDPTVTQAVSADPRLIIPKLNVDVPIHFGLQLSQVMDAMNSGVAHYRIAGASAYPGEMGNTVITGHSAGDVYDSNPYKYIFSGLERLEEGDLIYVNYQSVRYTYQVSGKKVVEPTDVKALVMESDVPMLTLVTCTPLGTSRYRLLVFAEQISPNPEEAEETGEDDDTVIDIESDDDSGLPSNAPSFFEGIWNFLTGNG